MHLKESTQGLPGSCGAESGMYNKVLNFSVVTCNLGTWNLCHRLKHPQKTRPPRSLRPVDHALALPAQTIHQPLWSLL